MDRGRTGHWRFDVECERAATARRRTGADHAALQFRQLAANVEAKAAAAVLKFLLVVLAVARTEDIPEHESWHLPAQND